MNQYNNALILEFNSRHNRDLLINSLLVKYPNPRAQRFIRENIHGHITSAVREIQHELSVSDPIMYLRIQDHLKYLNDKFVYTASKFIDQYIFNSAEDKQSFNIYESNQGQKIYEIDDFNPHNLYNTPLTSNNHLQNWETAPAKLRQLREDPQQGSHMCDDNISINYADTENQNTQNHMASYMLDTYKIALNGARNLDEPFGVSTPESDKRLMGRSIFRKGDGVTENSIPWYAKSLHVRNYEKNIDDSIQSTEYGYIHRGYDMSDLRSRMQMKRKLDH